MVDLALTVGKVCKTIIGLVALFLLLIGIGLVYDAIIRADYAIWISVIVIAVLTLFWGWVIGVLAEDVDKGLDDEVLIWSGVLWYAIMTLPNILHIIKELVT